MPPLILLIAAIIALFATTARADLPPFTDPVVSIDATYDQNKVYLLVGTKNADKTAPVRLQLTTSQDNGKTWSTPQPISTANAPITPRTTRGNDVRMAVHNGKIAIVWTQPGYGAMASGSLAATLSNDNGKTWTTPEVIYKTSPNKTDEHGARFPAITANDTGFHVIWIDAKIKDRALGYTSFDGQKWQPARILEPEMCACCWNVLKTTPDGRLYALYRDLCPSDMGLLTSIDNGATWTKTTPPGGFNWTIDGCPHTGGAIAFGTPATPKGPTPLFSTVWTGKDNITGGYVLTSTDNAKTWSDPLLLGKTPASPAIAHHTAIATSSQDLCIAYDAPINLETGQYAVFIASGKQDALTPIAHSAVQASPPNTKATHPLALATSDGFLVFWTQQEEGKPTTLQCKRIETPQ